MTASNRLQEVFVAGQARVREMLAARREHLAAVPQCTGQPLCPSQEVVGAIALTSHLDLIKLVLVELAMLGEAEDEKAALIRKLEIQRDLTGDVTTALESADRRATEAEEECQRLLARIDELEGGKGDTIVG